MLTERQGAILVQRLGELEANANGTTDEASILDQIEILVDIIRQNMNPLDSFILSDEDIAGATKYYGYVNSTGNWLIKKYDSANGTYRYCVGNSSYSTNFTNRAGLTYTYFNSL